MKYYIILILKVMIKVGSLQFLYMYIEEYQIYFIECGEKKSFLQVRSTSENADIFMARDEIYLVFAKKIVFFYTLR